MLLMPCFVPEEARAESIIIGTLMAGYGEIEMELCGCLISVEHNYDVPVRALFSKTGAEKRIKTAKKLLKPDYTKAGLVGPLLEATADMNYCREIRNQYAHSQWYWTSEEGLCFVNLEELAKQNGPILKLTAAKRAIKLPLLEKQEAFFANVKYRLRSLGLRYKEWDRHHSAAIPSSLASLAPPRIARPPRHN